MYSTDIDGAVGRIDADLDELSGVDLSALSATELVRFAERCETLLRRQRVVCADIAVELAGRDVAELGGAPHKVLADWVRISPAEARRRVRLAEPLAPRTTLLGEPLPAHRPATAAAWRAGDLDVEHVGVIARFFDELPLSVGHAEREEAEVLLATQARQLRPDQLAKVAEQLALLLNPDGVFSDADRAARRGFSWGPQQANGMSQGRLCATPALRAEIDALFAKFAAPGRCNPADQTPLIEGEPTQARIDADTRTHAQRQHDALSAVMRSLLGNPKLGKHNGLPVTVIVSATLQDLHDAAGVGITAAGTSVPMPDVIRMATHTYHYLSIFDKATRRALWLGRTKRIASADQRIVLHERDRGCTFPGCTVPGYGSQAHHATRDWADGGHTDIDDLAFSCGPHNRLVKHGGWNTRKLSNGTTEWIPPPHLPLRGGVNQYHHADTLVRRLYRQSARRHRPPQHQVNILRVAAGESDHAAPSPRFRPRRRAAVRRGRRRRSPHHR